MNSQTDTTTPNQQQKTARPLALGLAVVAGVLRLVPHPLNMSATGALGLFGGARLRSWQAYSLPLTVMAVTDLILWAIRGYSPFNVFVYGSFVIYVLLGRLLTRTESPLRIGTACVLGTVQFFLLTNLSAWLALSAPADQLPEGQAVVWTAQGGSHPVPTYARNVQGLLTCYAVALPFNNTDVPPLGFFGNMLVGDLLFCGLLFGVHAWLSRHYFRGERVPMLARAA